MMTATEALMKQQDEERDNDRLNTMVRAFIKRYQPEDRRDSLDFEMYLHEIVRATHREAVKPYEKILSSAVQGMSLQSFLREAPAGISKTEKP